MTANRTFNISTILLMGLAAGVLSYAVAEVLVPRRVANPGDHDSFLAVRLGFVYAPLVGLWLAWLQRSIARAALAIAVGTLVGLAYMWLSLGRNFLAIMVGFPALLGSALAALLASNRSEWVRDFPARLFKGLFAGFVLGFVYMFVLNMSFSMIAPYNDFVHDPAPAYVKAMWRAGPLALGTASALFFPLIRWAVGLTRVKLVVFEDVQPQNTPQAQRRPTRGCTGGAAVRWPSLHVVRVRHPFVGGAAPSSSQAPGGRSWLNA